MRLAKCWGSFSAWQASMQQMDHAARLAWGHFSPSTERRRKICVNYSQIACCSIAEELCTNSFPSLRLLLMYEAAGRGDSSKVTAFAWWRGRRAMYRQLGETFATYLSRQKNCQISDFFFVIIVSLWKMGEEKREYLAAVFLASCQNMHNLLVVLVSPCFSKKLSCKHDR